MTAPKTFREAFCDYFHVSPENYTREAVFKCLYPHAVFFFRICYPLQTVTIIESMQFINMVGQTRTDEELEDVISDYHNDMKDRSTYLARRWNMRVSARAVAKINQIIRRKI